MVKPNRVLSIFLTCLELSCDEWLDELFEHLLVKVVRVCPKGKNTRNEFALFNIAYLFLLIFTPFGHDSSFNARKGFQVIMPDDAEKSQVLGLQLQRTILDHLLKFTHILSILF